MVVEPAAGVLVGTVALGFNGATPTGPHEIGDAMALRTVNHGVANQPAGDHPLDPSRVALPDDDGPA